MALLACGGGGGGGGGGVSSATIARFTAALANASTDPNAPGLGLSNAQELTEVLTALRDLPTVEVQIDNQQPELWWICIWEVDDQVRGERYTVGAAISTDPADPDYLVWMTPKIGPQQTELDAAPSTTTGTAGLVLNETTPFLGVSPDAAGDTYKNDGSTLTGQIVYTSPCLGTAPAQYHYTAEKVEIDFALLSNFEGPGTPPVTRTGKIPPGALATTTGPVPSLRITYTAGCP
ncbi:MAG: hypothetical protein D6776_08990 [Planctomycetota bacterium]|nr:MAG: hypothetical protein D6776_08990 [Planctomycetota bacterium]